MRTLLILPLLLLLDSCIVTTQTTRFPTFDAAMRLPGSEDPPLVYEEDADVALLPTMVIFASLYATNTTGVSRETLARKIEVDAKTKGMKADLIVIGWPQWRVARQPWRTSDASYWAPRNPMASSSWGWLYRFTPSSMGFRTLNKMVVWISPKSDARSAGLQEGDVIKTVNGHPMCLTASFGLGRFMLQAKVGAALDVVWVRPGKGVMQAKIRTIPNVVEGVDRLPQLGKRAEGEKK